MDVESRPRAGQGLGLGLALAPQGHGQLSSCAGPHGPHLNIGDASDVHGALLLGLSGSSARHVEDCFVSPLPPVLENLPCPRVTHSCPVSFLPKKSPKKLGAQSLCMKSPPKEGAAHAGCQETWELSPCSCLFKGWGSRLQERSPQA